MLPQVLTSDPRARFLSHLCHSTAVLTPIPTRRLFLRQLWTTRLPSPPPTLFLPVFSSIITPATLRLPVARGLCSACLGRCIALEVPPFPADLPMKSCLPSLALTFTPLRKPILSPPQPRGRWMIHLPTVRAEGNSVGCLRRASYMPRCGSILSPVKNLLSFHLFRLCPVSRLCVLKPSLSDPGGLGEVACLCFPGWICKSVCGELCLRVLFWRHSSCDASALYRWRLDFFHFVL